MNTSNRISISLKKELWGTLSGIKFENLNISSNRTSKILSSIGKLNFSTHFNRLKLLILFELIIQNVHHLERLLKANYNVKPRRMNSNWIGLIGKLLSNKQFVNILIRIAPQPNRSVIWASSHKLFFKTKINWVDLLRMERRNKIVVGERFFSRLFKVYFNRNYLVWVCRK